MNKSGEATDKKGKGDKPIPFDEALRRLVNAPPQHKPAKNPGKRKKPARKG